MNKKNSSEDSKKEPMGFSEMRERYKNWVLGLSSASQKKYAIFAIIAIIVLPTVATLTIVRPLQPFLCFPAGIALFMLCLGFAFVSAENNPERPTMKEKYSAAQRLKWSIILGLIVLAFIVSSNAFIPYAFGGIIVLAIALGAYNFIQRTPEEIAYYEAGVMDPRDEESARRAEEKINREKTLKRKKEVE